MKSRNSLVLLSGASLALAIWMVTRPPEAPPAAPKVVLTEPSAAPKSPSVVAADAPVAAPVTPTEPQPPAPLPPPPASRPAVDIDTNHPLVESESPGPPARRAADAGPETSAAFDKIGLMLRDYRTLTGENPTGTNAEIMKAIMGGNPKGAMLGPPEGQQLNGDGELLDSWGTPYFFHQLSRDRMEIRSAGPDRRMWNGDDLTDG